MCPNTVVTNHSVSYEKELHFLDGKEVFTLLLTGFGKSLLGTALFFILFFFINLP